MKRTVKALQDLYVKLGGNLTDTYANIADGIKVGLYKRIPDIIEAVKEKASGGDVFDIKFTATYDETTGNYTASCNKTIAEIAAEYQANGYDNIRVSLEHPDSPAPLNLPVKLGISASDIVAYFIGFSLADDEMYVINVSAYPNQEMQEDVVTYENKVYLLTPSE